MRRFFLVGIAFLLSLFYGANQTFAAPNFHTKLQTTYDVNSSGATTVTHVLTLTNKTPTEYISRYGLKITSPDITQVTVKNNGQVITPEIVSTETQTAIGITFPDVIAGEGKSRIVEISYRDPDAAVISGKVLEVLVPKLASANEYDEYNLTLITPNQFGSPTRVTPNTFTVEQTNSRVVTRLALSQGEGVTALYGNQQIFDFKLKYHLTNPSPNTGLAQIALPPDTSLQKVNYSVLEPLPQKLEADADGNWIATYQVPAEAKVVVSAQGQAYVSLQKLNNLSLKENIDTWLKPQEFWEVNDVKIKDLAQQHTSAKQIYDYVVDTLDYNYASIENETPRLGALNTLSAPNQAACQEFTDVFISIARAAGIPARRVTGYAYTQNNLLRPRDLNRNILHAWPEYFDQARQEWIPIDPTWGNTTGGVNYFDQFDLNHVVFAINGQSSSLPFPVGSYATNEVEANESIEVTFGDIVVEQQPQVDLTTRLGTLGGVPMPGKNQLIVTNQTGQAWYNITLRPQTRNSGYRVPAALRIPELLPYQSLVLNLPVYNLSWVGIEQVQLQLSADYEETITKQRHTISLNPVTISAGGQVFYFLGQPVVAVALGISCLLGTIFAGSLLVRRTKRQGPVRRKS